MSEMRHPRRAHVQSDREGEMSDRDIQGWLLIPAMCRKVERKGEKKKVRRMKTF